MKRNLTIIIVFVAIIAALFAVAAARKPKPPTPTTQRIWQESGVPVEISTATLGEMDESVQITGDLNALNCAVISAKNSGRLISVSVREGDRVSRGQTVAVLDQSDALSNHQTAQAGLASAQARLAQTQTNAEVTKIQTQAAVEQAQANVAAAKARLAVAQRPTRSQERMMAEQQVNAAKANLEKAEADYKRNDRLLQRGAISESAFDVVKAQYVVAQANYKSAQEQLGMIDEGGRQEDISNAQAQVAVAQSQLQDARANAGQNRVKEKDVLAARAVVKQAQAAVDTTQRQLDDTYIKSPIAGVISARSADPGQIVSPGQVLSNVVDLSSIYFKGDIPEKYLSQVNKGQAVSVRLDAMPNETLPGRVAEVYPSGSTSNRNFSGRIAILGQNDHVRPGMSASGEILVAKKRGVLLVPKDAVDDQEGTQSVFTVSGDNTAKRHVVTVVRTDRHNAQITATDIQAGDRVVTQGRKNLQEGSKVELHNGKGAKDVAN
jgi:RND family efflux transporter MFP subunit